MLIGQQGRVVKDLEEAEAYVKTFVRSVYDEEDPGGPQHRHSLDYDLFVPWLWENVSNAKVEDAPLEGSVLERLYMDAAWSLVQKGYLRPGPRNVMGGGGSGDGKGYSLTIKGREWIEGAAE
ncbi:hypothetical protein EON79_00060 [bacterium]|nr:MAG: hypothetical protein EON79_00060 [bacterium]